MARISPIQRLTRTYIGGLVMIALLAIGGYALLAINSQRLSQYDTLLVLTHRQQIRAQQTALLATELALFANASQAASIRAELRTLSAELLQTHQRLLEEAPATPINHLTPALDRFLVYVNNLVEAPPDQLNRDNLDLYAIQTNLITVQSDLSAISSLLLMQSQALRDQVSLMQAGVLAMILLLLTTGGLLVIHPFARSARREADQLRMLSLVARYTDNAVIITDRNGLIEWINEGFTRISGYTLDEVRGREPGEFLHGPETDPATVAAISQALRNGESIKAEIVNYTKQGRPYWLALDISPVYDDQHNLTHFIAIESDITHQKEMERMLRAALKESRDVMNALDQSAILSIADPEGRILEVNERFCAITGYRPDELIGKDHRIFKSGVHPPEFFAEMWNTIKSGHIWRNEICNRAKDGRLFWVDTTIVPFIGENGQPERYLSVRFDITARKKSEEELHASEARYRSVITAMSEGIVVMNKAGVIETCNASAERILGLTYDQIVGRTSFDPRWQTIHEDGSPFPGEEHPIMVALTTGRPQSDVIMGVHKPSGDLTWISINSQPLCDDHGQVYAAVASFHDITARRLAEQELRFQKTLLECQTEASPDGVLVVSPERRCLYANRRFREMWSLDDLPIEQTTCAASMDAMLAQVSDPERVRNEIEELYANPHLTGKAEIELKDGRTFERYSAPVISAEGDYYGRVWFFRDVTERRAVERMKNEFVAVVSHELRTPLTSIRGSLGLLAGGVAGELPPRAAAMIDIALKNSERLVRLINDILDIEKIESGKMVFKLQPVVLDELVRQAIEANCGFGQQYDVKIELTTTLPNVQVYVDPDRMTQVFTNLISNAVKFSPAGGKVEVAIGREPQGRVRITVTDHGPGIPVEFRDRIFQKFAQADSSNTRQQGGTGLGLSISRAIVERHGGQIGFVTATGVGTSFYVDLIEYRANTTSLPMPAAPKDAPRILICEDDPDIAALLSLMLQQAGYATDVAYTLTEARELLQQRDYRAMTLDLMWPNEDGSAFIREVRDKARTHNLPIVVVSARADEEQTISGEGVDVVDWLPKPIDQQRLLTALRRAARHAGASRPQVLHIEDDSDVVAVVRLLLADIAEVQQAATIAEAQHLLCNQAFDLVILDQNLPDGNGIDLLPLIERQQPPLQVILFSVRDRDPDIANRVAVTLVKSRTTNTELLTAVTRLLDQAAPAASSPTSPR
ncbi:PAS domain S-box protein [Chloroflexus sp.]|uniref:PAS domain S-box protein n=1 Tax=Chloroflexus sp. TaxID=1904827 RepID=UPI002ACF0122|nr:PAS domain S-box protein [Chloroflexus sp.]